MHKSLVPIVICPVCHGELNIQIDKQDEYHIIDAKFNCQDCKRTYPVIDGIAIFLADEGNRDDLWKEQETLASRFRREHPIQHFLLTKTFLGNVKPEHYFLKGLILESERILDKATKRIYTKDYLIGYEKTKQALWEVEKGNPSLILETACGRGGFFKPFLQSRKGDGVYVASDFSPTILRSNMKWLRISRLDGHVTLMAFDARAMPFRDDSIPAGVSNLGFPNIRSDGKTVHEAFRVLAPKGLLIANFMFTTEGTENYEKARDLGFDKFYTRKNVEMTFKNEGFKFSLEELHRGLVRPTPGGIDTLPIVQDTYSFCVVHARKPQ